MNTQEPFYFRDNGKKYVVNFTHVTIKRYTPSGTTKRIGTLAVLRAQHTGVPYTGIAIIDPSDGVLSSDEIDSAYFLAVKRAISSLVWGESKRGQESKVRERIHDMYTKFEIEFLKLDHPEESKFLEEYYQEELVARGLAKGKQKNDKTTS